MCKYVAAWSLKSTFVLIQFYHFISQILNLVNSIELTQLKKCIKKCQGVCKHETNYVPLYMQYQDAYGQNILACLLVISIVLIKTNLLRVQFSFRKSPNLLADHFKVENFQLPKSLFWVKYHFLISVNDFLSNDNIKQTSFLNKYFNFLHFLKTQSFKSDENETFQCHKWLDLQ